MVEFLGCRGTLSTQVSSRPPFFDLNPCTGEACFAVCIACAFLCFGTFVLTSMLLPVACLVLELLQGGEHRQHPLEIVLSSLSGGLLCMLVALGPSVVRFQLESHLLNPALGFFQSASYYIRGVNSSWYDDRDLMEPSEYTRGTEVVDLETLKRAYNAWIVGCQVQAGLLERFGRGVPSLIFDAGHRQQSRMVIKLSHVSEGHYGPQYQMEW